MLSLFVLGYSVGENVAATDSTCLGKLQVGGRSPVEIVGERYITPGTTVAGDSVTLPLAPRESGSANRAGARVYFADSCEEGKYSPERYTAWPLWNKTISFSVDLSGVSCGCNFAFYLTSLRYSRTAGRQGQGSWYCDAQPTAESVCPEMDLMEANKHGWRTTAHKMYDGSGQGGGVGSGQAFSAKEYGPGGSHVDTTKPFKASVSFATDSNGRLVDVLLTLEGAKTLSASVVSSDYALDFTFPLMAGMTPVISYWTAADMTWLDSMGYNKTGISYDGNGDDGCPWDWKTGYPSDDNQDTCADAVKISKISVSEYVPTVKAAEPKRAVDHVAASRGEARLASLRSSWLAAAP